MKAMMKAIFLKVCVCVRVRKCVCVLLSVCA